MSTWQGRSVKHLNNILAREWSSHKTLNFSRRRWISGHRFPQARSSFLTFPEEIEGETVNHSKQHISKLAKWLRGYTNNSMTHSEFEWEKKFVDRDMFGVEYGVLAVFALGWRFLSIVFSSSWSQRWMLLTTQF